MSIQEYETYDLMEMAFLYDMGFPFEMNKENPRKVIMIVKGDPDHIASLIRELWDTDRSKFRRHYNAIKAVKQSTWVGGVYDPNFKNRNNGEEAPAERRTVKAHQ